MKQPWEWTEAELLALIKNGVQESLVLDYKQSDSLGTSDAKKRALSKDISSFANAAGGTLVYGIVEQNHLPVRLDDGLDPGEVSREWLEQVINSTIQRRIPDVRINPIPIDGVRPGRVAYVVYVPQSRLAPHMAADKRYYKRFNFQSVPMEEYEVRDVANRQQGPDLTGEMALEAKGELIIASTGTEARSTVFKVQLLVTNHSPQAAEFRVITTYTDARLLKGQKSDGFHLRIGNHNVPVVKWSKNQGPPGFIPLWQGSVFVGHEWDVSVPNVDLDADYPVMWTINTPNMEPREGLAVLRVRSRTATFENVRDTPLASELVGLPSG